MGQAFTFYTICNEYLVSKSTKCTPYQIIYGNNPRLSVDFIVENPEIQHDFEPSKYSDNLSLLLNRTYEIIRQNKDFKSINKNFITIEFFDKMNTM